MPTWPVDRQTRQRLTLNNVTLLIIPLLSHLVREKSRWRNVLESLAACRRENAMAHYKALRLVRSRPFAQKNHMSVSESVRVREAFLPVWYLSTIAYRLPRPS